MELEKNTHIFNILYYTTCINKCTKYHFNKLKYENITKYCNNKTKATQTVHKTKDRLIASIKKIHKLDSLNSLALFGLK